MTLKSIHILIQNISKLEKLKIKRQKSFWNGWKMTFNFDKFSKDIASLKVQDDFSVYLGMFHRTWRVFTKYFKWWNSRDKIWYEIFLWATIWIIKHFKNVTVKLLMLFDTPCWKVFTNFITIGAITNT